MSLFFFPVTLNKWPFLLRVVIWPFPVYVCRAGIPSCLRWLSLKVDPWQRSRLWTWSVVSPLIPPCFPPLSFPLLPPLSFHSLLLSSLFPPPQYRRTAFCWRETFVSKVNLRCAVKITSLHFFEALRVVSMLTISVTDVFVACCALGKASSYDFSVKTLFPCLRWSLQPEAGSGGSGFPGGPGE